MILRQAAVIGTETDVRVLGAVAAADDRLILDAVEAGLLTGLITEPADGQIRFAHALVRDTLYDGLSRLRRSRLHARAAAAIERHYPGDVAALAYQYGCARMSRTVMPRAYKAMIRSLNPSSRVWPLRTICGSKVPLRSRGT